MAANRAHELGRNAAVAAAIAALDFVLPPVCAACDRLASDRTEALVCGVCWSRLLSLASPRCERCGHPSDQYDCRWCPLLPPYVRAARSVCWVASGTALAIVHALKYGGWTRVAEGMGTRMARLAFPDDVARERTALVPVPLARARERERGYNQSELLARSVAIKWKIPVWNDVIARGRATESQTRLTPEQRRRNVSSAFTVAPRLGARLRGAHIVLVDDVVTTAATLNAWAAALYDGGARIISYATFGRAPSIGDRVATTGELLDGNSRRH
ncbi:MAG: ComF family protein [Gemmatimonadaceae bacterium]